MPASAYFTAALRGHRNIKQVRNQLRKVGLLPAHLPREDELSFIITIIIIRGKSRAMPKTRPGRSVAPRGGPGLSRPRPSHRGAAWRGAALSIARLRSQRPNSVLHVVMSAAGSHSTTRVAWRRGAGPGRARISLPRASGHMHMHAQWRSYRLDLLPSPHPSQVPLLTGRRAEELALGVNSLRIIIFQK